MKDLSMMKPRIKICGLTRVEDVDVALEAGADAIGLVFYPPSPRYVDLAVAAELARRIPPFVSIVGLFVNAEPERVRATLAALPIHLLQFHGDEDDAYCRQFDRPFMKAARVKPGMDLVQYCARFPSAQAILLDAFVEGYGGGGKSQIAQRADAVAGSRVAHAAPGHALRRLQDVMRCSRRS